MKYSIEMDHGLKAIKYKHKGDLHYDDLMNAWQAILKLKEFTELKYNLFSNYKDARLIMKLEEVDQVLDFLFNLKPILEGKKQAIVIVDPHSTMANKFLRNDAYNTLGFIVQNFSNEKSALEWLGQ